jgi:hypothetical protein
MEMTPKPSMTGQSGQTAAPPVVHDVLRSPGQTLDPATLAFMEPRLGHDFSRVRVHTDTNAAHASLVESCVGHDFGQIRVLPESQADDMKTKPEPEDENNGGMVVVAQGGAGAGSKAPPTTPRRRQPGTYRHHKKNLPGGNKASSGAAGPIRIPLSRQPASRE